MWQNHIPRKTIFLSLLAALIFTSILLCFFRYAYPNELSQFSPPLSQEELKFYQEIKTDMPGRVHQFIETRKYFRKIKSLFPHFDFDQDLKKVPEPSKDVKVIFCLDDKEVTLFVYIKAEISKRKRGEK